MKTRTPSRIPLAAAIIAALLLSLLPGAFPARAQSASITLEPSVTLPNQDITLVGTSFPADDTLTVKLTVHIRGGGNQTVTTVSVTDDNGDFAVAFKVPSGAAPGMYSVTAIVTSVQMSTRLRVLPLSEHSSFLNFRWISLWYHTVRQGTWDFVILQSTLVTRLGIWVHVIFPNGLHLDFFTATNGSGRWFIRFNIPRRAISRHSNQAYVTFQLWHGNQTTQNFMTFTLV
jgi:hypothetical protein